MEEKKHIMTMLVDNQPGVLSRVVGLFSGKGFNIESLCVAATMDPQVSRITIVTMANPPIIEQIEKQLRKLINIIKHAEPNSAREKSFGTSCAVPSEYCSLKLGKIC